MKRYCCHPKCCLIVLALLLLACGCSCGGGQEPLLQDDFDNPRSGWGIDQREEFDRGYEEGEYFIELYEPNWLSWAQHSKKFDDVQIEVDVYLASGPSDGHFGVLCRHADVDNFYYFAISADGYYAIFRRVDGDDLEVLTGDGAGMTYSPDIKTGRQINRVRAVCRGEKLSLYVNGEILEAVTDDAHPQGLVGIGAGSGSAGNSRVQFDDLAVAEP